MERTVVSSGLVAVGQSERPGRKVWATGRFRTKVTAISGRSTSKFRCWSGRSVCRKAAGCSRWGADRVSRYRPSRDSCGRTHLAGLDIDTDLLERARTRVAAGPRHRGPRGRRTPAAVRRRVVRSRGRFRHLLPHRPPGTGASRDRARARGRRSFRVRDLREPAAVPSRALVGTQAPLAHRARARGRASRAALGQPRQGAALTPDRLCSYFLAESLEELAVLLSPDVEPEEVAFDLSDEPDEPLSLLPASLLPASLLPASLLPASLLPASFCRSPCCRPLRRPSTCARSR